MKFKALYIVMMSVLLGACGGENSDLPKQGKDSTPAPAPAPTPEPEPEGGGDNTVVAPLASIVIEKQGNVKVGETLNAILTSCTNCVDSSLQYTWVIDSNDDGVYDINADTVVTGSSLPLIDAYRKHSIRLSATVENSQGIVANSNDVDFDGPLLLPEITQLKNKSDFILGEPIEVMKSCNNCDPNSYKTKWYVDSNEDGNFTSDEEVTAEADGYLLYEEAYKGLPIKVTMTVDNLDGEASEEKYAVFSNTYPEKIIAPKHKILSSGYIIPTPSVIKFSDDTLRGEEDGDYKIISGVTEDNFQYTSSGAGIFYWSDNTFGSLGRINDGTSVLLLTDDYINEHGFDVAPSEISDVVSCEDRYLIKLKSGELKVLGGLNNLFFTKANPSGNVSVERFLTPISDRHCRFIDQEGWFNTISNQPRDLNKDLNQQQGEVLSDFVGNSYISIGFALVDDMIKRVSKSSLNTAVSYIHNASEVKQLNLSMSNASYLTNSGELVTYYTLFGAEQVENEQFKKIIELPINEVTIAVKNDDSIVAWGEAIYTDSLASELINIKDTDVKAYRNNAAGTYFVMKDGTIFMKPNQVNNQEAGTSLIVYQLNDWAVNPTNPDDLEVIETGIRSALMIHNKVTKDLYVFHHDPEKAPDLYENILIAEEGLFYSMDGVIYRNHMYDPYVASSSFDTRNYSAVTISETNIN